MTVRAGAGRRRLSSIEELIPSLLERSPLALGRAISLLEAGGEEAEELVGRLYSRTGQARVVGVTGPPGAGKSTLVDQLARTLRKSRKTVGVLAVDPTSPFTGGALLGDRIRMQSLYTDPGVFIRSMATRGHLGGLARATQDAIDLLDAAGFDFVLVETVGVGQDEVDIVGTVDTVLVVTVPGLGDEIQVIKAGLMEIADLFVLNKADRDGVERARRHLETLLDGVADETDWRPPIVETVATLGRGIDEVLTGCDDHAGWLGESGDDQRRRRRRLRMRCEQILRDRVLAAIRGADLDAALRRALDSEEDPYQLAERLYQGLFSPSPEEDSA